MPHMRPITGSCGLASGSRKNALPASRGASSVEMPSAVRALMSARPVGVEGSAIRPSLIEGAGGPLGPIERPKARVAIKAELRAVDLAYQARARRRAVADDRQGVVDDGAVSALRVERVKRSVDLDVEPVGALLCVPLAY